MKFLFNIILISSCLSPNWAYPCDVQGIPEPSHLLSFQYSKLHNLQPKNGDPNIVYPKMETLVVVIEMNDLSFSLPKYLYSKKVGIQCAYEYDLYLQLPSKYEHPPNYRFASTNLDNGAEDRLSERGNGTLSPIQYGNLNYLLNVNSFGALTFNKTKIFIETKVTAMKLQGFNL